MADPVATQDQEIAWYDVIGQFQKAAADFEAMYNKLVSQKAVASRDPALAQEYNALMSTAESIKQKIIEIRNATADFINWFKDLFGFSGMGQLGFLPLIPIAVVVASVALIGKWVSDAYIFSQKLEKVNQLEKQGVPTGTAVTQVQKLTSGGSILGFDPKWLVIGGILIVTAPVLIPAIKSAFKK